MIKRLLTLLLALCLIFQAAPVYAGAAEGQRIIAGEVTVTAGNTASVTLRAENLANIAVLGIEVYYDPAVLTYSSNSAGSMLSGTQYSVGNPEPGLIKLEAITLSEIKGSGNLLTLYFSTSADCPPGKHPITVAIGRVADTSFEPVSVSGVSGSVTINEKPATIETFRLFGYIANQKTLQKGDVLPFQVVNSGSNTFVSGDFVVEYDPKIFAFDSVKMESQFAIEGAVYSINSAVAGKVYLSYASATPTNSYFLYTVNLKVIGDVDGTTTVTATASNVRKEDLSLFAPGSSSRTITLQKLPVVEDYPDAYLSKEQLVVGEECKSTLYLEAEAGVAATQFSITYDPAVLRCTAVETAAGLSEKGGMVVKNDNFANGTISFSYINQTPYSAEDLAIVEITWIPIQSPASHYEIAVGSSKVVDINNTTIQLEYPTDTGCIFTATVQPATCQKEGLITYLCGCDAEDTPQVLPVLPEEECTHYTVRFVDHDGTEISAAEYHLGDAVVVPEDPFRVEDNACTYAFSGWDKEVTECKGDATYTATYASTYKEYTVIFVDEDGTELSKKTYHWGEEIDVPADPTKEADDIYTYAFSGWNEEVTECKGDATYTATYASTYKEYTVIFVDEDGTELSKKTYHWGDEVEAPADPTKEADDTYTYVFSGWNPEVVACEGDAVYTAVYTSEKLEYADIVTDEETLVDNTVITLPDSFGLTQSEINGMLNGEQTKGQLEDVVTEQVKNTVKVTVTDAIAALGELYDNGGEKPSIEIRSYLSAHYSAPTTSGTISSIKVDLHAWYELYAVQGENSAKLGEAKDLNTQGTDIAITLVLPDDFVRSEKQLVQIKHIKTEETTYTYLGTLGKNAEGKDTVTFINPNGFSEFEVTVFYDETELPKMSVNLTLNETVDMNFYVPQNVVSKAHSYLVMRNGVEVNKSDYTVTLQEDGRIRIRYSMNADRMCDAICAQVFDVDGNPITKHREESIRSYAALLLGSTASNYDKMLVTAMLDYGALAQIANNTVPDTGLANSVITSEIRDVVKNYQWPITTSAEDEASGTSTASGLGLNLTLNETVDMNFLARENVLDGDYTVIVKKNGVKLSPNEYTITKMVDGRYRVRYSMNADKMCDVISVQIVNADGTESKYQPRAASIRHYGQMLLNSNQRDLDKYLIIALLDYGSLAQINMALSKKQSISDIDLANRYITSEQRAFYNGYNWTN